MTRRSLLATLLALPGLRKLKAAPSPGTVLDAFRAPLAHLPPPTLPSVQFGGVTYYIDPRCHRDMPHFINVRMWQDAILDSLDRDRYQADVEVAHRAAQRWLNRPEWADRA